MGQHGIPGRVRIHSMNHRIIHTLVHWPHWRNGTGCLARMRRYQHEMKSVNRLFNINDRRVGQTPSILVLMSKLERCYRTRRKQITSSTTVYSHNWRGYEFAQKQNPVRNHICSNFSKSKTSTYFVWTKDRTSTSQILKNQMFIYLLRIIRYISVVHITQNLPYNNWPYSGMITCAINEIRLRRYVWIFLNDIAH